MSDGTIANPFSGRQRKRTWLACLAIGGIALAVYLRTMARVVVFGDSGELITAVYLGSVAHPTGYPFYSILGYSVTHILPFGSVAVRMNLLSAVIASAAVCAFYQLSLLIVRRRIIGAAASLLLAFSITFWAQGVSAEVYGLHVLFVISVLTCLVRWDRDGNVRYLRFAAMLWGFSFTHHLTTLLLAPAVVYYVATSPYRRAVFRDLPSLALLFCSPLVLYLYLPWASQRRPTWQFADIGSWPAFVDHVTGKLYHEKTGVPNLQAIWDRLLDFMGPLVHDEAGRRDRPAYLLSQFSVSILWLAPWGLYSLLWRRKRIFGLTFLLFLACVAWGMLYNIPDIDEYYLPAYVMVALWIACGTRSLGIVLARVWKRARVPAVSQRRLRRGYAVASLGLGLMLMSLNWTANDLNRNDISGWLGVSLLDSLKPGAVYVCAGDQWVMPLIYPHFVEGCRPDVTIVPAFNFVLRGNAPLIDRLSHRGLYVPFHPGTRKWVGKTTRDNFALFLKRNRDRVPLYIAGPRLEGLAINDPAVHDAAPVLERVGGNEPVYLVRSHRDAHK